MLLSGIQTLETVIANVVASSSSHVVKQSQTATPPRRTASSLLPLNIHIMRAFVKQREFLANQKDLKARIDDLEKKYDRQFQIVFKAIKKILEPQTPNEARVTQKTARLSIGSAQRLKKFLYIFSVIFDKAVL